MMNKTRLRLYSRRFAAWKPPERTAVKRYLTALLAQSVLSVFNAGLNIFLVLALIPHDYGAFALCLVFGILGTSINGALACNPLVVFGTIRLGRPSRRAVEALLSSVNAAVVAFVFVLSVPLVGIFTGEGLFVCLLAAASISALTARSYTRSFAYARQLPQVALGGDLTLITVASVLLLAANSMQGLVTLQAVFVSLTAGNSMAMTVEISSLRLGLRLVRRRSSLRRYLAIWKDVRWSLVGSTTTLLQTQAHSFLVSLFVGPAAYAPLAAGQVIFGPVRIMMSAWTLVMQPELVLAIRSKAHKQILRTLTISALALASLVVAIGVALALLWPLIYALLYAGKYSAETMTWIVAAWCAITLWTAVGCSPSAVLQTFRNYRTLAFGSVYGAGISILGVALLLFTVGAEWSLLGILMAEAFLAWYMLGHALRSIHTLA
jgi:O-antigen/teichoic acid export membrane protein